MFLDIIISILLVLILGSAIIYIIKSKKSGKKCIGCPGGCSTCTSKEDNSPKASEPCSCGCTSCAMKDSCQSNAATK